MDHFGEQPKFEVQPVIEQRPFESSAVQSFFQQWCEINDSIAPQIVNRETWEQRGVKAYWKKGRMANKLYICRKIYSFGKWSALWKSLTMTPLRLNRNGKTKKKMSLLLWENSFKTPVPISQ